MMAGLAVKLLVVAVLLLTAVLVCVAVILWRLLVATLGGTHGHWQVDVVARTFVDKRLSNGEDWEPVGCFLNEGSAEPMVVVRRWVTYGEDEAPAGE